MENMPEKIAQLHLEKNITLEDIPNIDLYMDQVLQLFENTFQDTRRNEEEKILTKTMINNYAKGKVLLPIQNKKYSKEHIILLSLIYQLKGSLSINDIKKSLEKVNEKINVGENFDLEAFYGDYLKLEQENILHFQQDITKKIESVNDTSKSKKDSEMDRILLLISLVNMSNMYRRLAERIIDEID